MKYLYSSLYSSSIINASKSISRSLSATSKTIPGLIHFIDDEGKLCNGYSSEAMHAPISHVDFVINDEGKVTQDKRKIGKLLPPARPFCIIGIGLNYKKHAIETNNPIPQVCASFYINVHTLNLSFTFYSILLSL